MRDLEINICPHHRVIFHRLGAQEASVSWRPPNLAGTELGGCAAFRAWSYRLEMEDTASGEVITKRGLQGNRVSLNKSDQLQPATLYKVSSASSFLL